MFRSHFYRLRKALAMWKSGNNPLHLSLKIVYRVEKEMKIGGNDVYVSIRIQISFKVKFIFALIRRVMNVNPSRSISLHRTSSNLYSSVQPDYSIVDDDYHGAMIACLQGYFKSSPQGQWLLIGLGGGVLSMKLLRAFPKVRWDRSFVLRSIKSLSDSFNRCGYRCGNASSSKEMVRIRWSTQHVCHRGWSSISRSTSSREKSVFVQFFDHRLIFSFDLVSFDVIIIDVNNDDNQSSLRCPHPSFLNDSVLSNVHQLLSSSSSGLFLLNFASRDPSSPDRDRCRTELLQHFSHLSSLKLDEDINEIFLCSDQSLEKISMNKSIDSNLKELFEKLRLEKWVFASPQRRRFPRNIFLF